MRFRTSKSDLLQTLSIWNGYLKKKVHLIACGGTALTLIGIKDSTKDIDLIVPEIDEYEYLIKNLKAIGYRQITGYGWARDSGFVFDLYPSKRIFMTELLESPLKSGNNQPILELSWIYMGVLNHYDLIISKLFRSSPVDIKDCKDLLLAKKDDIDLEVLKARFYETSSYDVSDEKNKTNLRHFLKGLEGAEKNG